MAAGTTYRSAPINLPAPADRYDRSNEAQFRRTLEQQFVNITAYIERLIADPVSVATHGTQHQNGGEDEISVAGLSGLLADAQTPLAHKTSHQNGGADEISVAGLSGLLADAQTPLDHASGHFTGGGDPISPFTGDFDILGDLSITTDSIGGGATMDMFSGSASNGTRWLFRRSRGSIASPTNVLDGDQIFSIEGQARDSGGVYRNVAAVRMEIDGTPGSNDMPGRLVFYTVPDGSGSLTRRWTIDNTGAFWPGSDASYDIGTEASAIRKLYFTDALVFMDSSDNDHLALQGMDGAYFGIGGAPESGYKLTVHGELRVEANTYDTNGNQILTAQQTAVADAAGGATVDTEARAALNALLARLRSHGLIAT